MLFGCGAKSDVDNSSGSMPEMESGISNDMAKPVLGERKQIVYTEVSYDTNKYDEMIETINQSVSEAGGYIQDGNQRNYNENSRSASYVIRIPADKVETLLALLDDLGKVNNRNDRVEDITDSYTDLEMRVEMLNVEYQRLLELLAKAEDIQTTLTIEQRMNELIYQMESYKNELKNYDLLMQYTTLTIRIHEKAAIVKDTGSMFDEIKNTFVQSIDSIIQGAQWLIVTLIGNILYIVILVLFIFGGYKLVSKLRKK